MSWVIIDNIREAMAKPSRSEFMAKHWFILRLRELSAEQEVPKQEVINWDMYAVI